MFFKKKRKESSDNSEIVDELPYLAMDVMEKRQEQGNTAPQQETLPQMPQQTTTQRSSIPRPSAVNPNPRAETAAQTENPYASAEERKGYFNDLLEKLGEESTALSEDLSYNSQRLLEGDLLENMKKTWEEHKEDVLFTYEEKNLRANILDKINMLKDLESAWQENHLKVIEHEEKIRLEEAELKKMVQDFRDMCTRHVGGGTTKHGRERKKILVAEPSRVFTTSDGEKIISTEGLAAFIERNTATTLKKYVNEEKNDFANWIRYAFNDSSLANRVNKAREKKDLLVALKK